MKYNCDCHGLATQTLWAVNIHDKGDWSSGKDSQACSSGNFQKRGGRDKVSGESYRNVVGVQGFKTVNI